MRAGRFVCVALPLILTVGAIIAYMVATLSGVAHSSLYIFRVDLSDLDIDDKSIDDLVSNLGIFGRGTESTRGITAGNLGFADSYDVTLWGYCENKKDKDRECIKAQFNWAESRLQKDFLDPIAGKNVELPDEIKTALNIFSTVTKFTEIAFVVALICLGVELFVGVFSNCTRIISCITSLISVVAIAFSLAASGLATAMALVVVSAIKTAGRTYGVKGNFNGAFLACIWIGFAFSLAAGLFWLFTLCCCKPDHREKRRSDGEKLIPSTGYYPIGNDHEMTGGNNAYHNQYQSSYAPSYNNSSNHNTSSHHGYNNSDVAYEPFSHRA